MDDGALTHWLLEHGGPAIRYRTATELMDDGDAVDPERLTASLVESPMVREWLNRLTPLRPGDLFNLHGANPDAFENVCAKLCELGIRAGLMEDLDKRLLAYRRYLAEGDFLGKICLVAPLNWMGYGADEAVQAHLGERLARMFALARSGVYDIYIDHDTFGDCPAAFRKRPLVNPTFYDQLPGIWDIYALAHYPEALRSDETASCVEAVVAYVLDPRYQALDEGYGYMRSGPRRYHSIGWSLHLPGYHGFDFSRALHAAMFVQRVELMAHFPVARRSQWFWESLRHLEGFRTETGTYRFPARYLREQANGYWVQGAYMRLEQDRRSRQSLEIESTFRMLKIKQKGVYGDARVK